jgi:hypothetical protein
VDSDLTESIAALRAALEQLEVDVAWSRGDPKQVTQLKERFGLPRRYVEFLLESNPSNVETATPAERVQFIALGDLLAEQADHSVRPDGSLITKPTRSGWRPTWFIVARSGLLGDPYFLDTSQVDAEGDCPVYCAMSGTDVWHPKLCGSNFTTFLKVLAVTMEVAQDFDMDDFDPDNERVFREAVGPRIREVDPAAQKAGHWT